MSNQLQPPPPVPRFLCPLCLQLVVAFSRRNAKNTNDIEERSFACPACKGPVPIRYAEDYDRHPPLIMNITGLRSHGKTVFLGSLLHAFDKRVHKFWPRFTYMPLDEGGLKFIRDAQVALENGRLPPPNPEDNPEGKPLPPVMVEIDGLPDGSNRLLLLYDTSGEWFKDGRKLKLYAGAYLTRSPTIVWLVSLSNVLSSADLIEYLTVYIDAIRQLGGDPRRQTLVVTLTKGDEFVNRDDVPDAIKEYLMTETTVSGPEELDRYSAAIRTWLANDDRYRHLVALADKHFRGVRYCVVTATGVPPVGNTLRDGFAPRRVLAPLQWLLTFQPPPKADTPKGSSGCSVLLAVAVLLAGGIIAFGAGMTVAGH